MTKISGIMISFFSLYVSSIGLVFKFFIIFKILFKFFSESLYFFNKFARLSFEKLLNSYFIIFLAISI